MYNRTNTGRRETGEFFGKLITEVCGAWGDGAREGKEPGIGDLKFEIEDAADRLKAELQHWDLRRRDLTEVARGK